MIATEDIVKGEIVVFIPEEMFLTEKSALQSQTVQYLKENNLLEKFGGKVPHMMLTLYLMEERLNPGSNIDDMIALLPKDWSQFPLMYTNEDLKWLKGSELEG